jgi:hypothetical protein
MFVVLFGVGVASMVNNLGADFFRVMSSIVSMVSSAGFPGLEIDRGNAWRPA